MFYGGLNICRETSKNIVLTVERIQHGVGAVGLGHLFFTSITILRNDHHLYVPTKVRVVTAINNNLF